MTATDTHVLIEFDPGGLLLDLQSGQLFRLNQSAALVWQRHLAGDSVAQIAHALGRRYGIAEARARGDVDAALSQSLAENRPAASSPEFHYQRTAEGYLFSHLGQPIFLIDQQGQTISRAPTADLGHQEIRRLLSSVAPKLLSLRGQTVLHASAVSIEDRVLVFSGASGAGKTTTARAMVKAAARSVCEDKLVVRLRENRVDAVVDTESVVAAWVEMTAVELAAGRPASCSGLAAVENGPSLPLAEIGFLSVERRAGDALGSRALPPTEAAAAIFSNSFYGSADPSDWKKQLTVSAAMARHIAAFEMTAPAGISRLVEAAHQVVVRGSLKMAE